MIRALLIAALLTGLAMHFLGTDPSVAFGYALVLSVTLWFLWPLLRGIPRLARRHRGRRRQPSRAVKTAAQPLTQINHHHYYYGVVLPAPAAMTRPDYSRPALPLRTQGQKAHDAIYDIIDIDNDPTR